MINEVSDLVKKAWREGFSAEDVKYLEVTCLVAQAAELDEKLSQLFSELVSKDAEIAAMKAENSRLSCALEEAVRQKNEAKETLGKVCDLTSRYANAVKAQEGRGCGVGGLDSFRILVRRRGRDDSQT